MTSRNLLLGQGVGPVTKTLSSEIDMVTAGCRDAAAALIPN